MGAAEQRRHLRVPRPRAEPSAAGTGCGTPQARAPPRPCARDASTGSSASRPGVAGRAPSGRVAAAAAVPSQRLERPCSGLHGFPSRRFLPPRPSVWWEPRVPVARILPLLGKPPCSPCPRNGRSPVPAHRSDRPPAFAVAWPGVRLEEPDHCSRGACSRGAWHHRGQCPGQAGTRQRPATGLCFPVASLKT